MILAPQLAFKGNCAEAFAFYADLFDGEIVVMNRFGDNQNYALPPGSKAGGDDKVRFAEVRFGDNILRGNDLSDDEFTPMQGFNISLHVPDATQARRIFDGLAKGGEVTVPPAKVDWAALFGMVTDQFGVPWLILGMEE